MDDEFAGKSGLLVDDSTVCDNTSRELSTLCAKQELAKSISSVVLHE